MREKLVPPPEALAAAADFGVAPCVASVRAPAPRSTASSSSSSSSVFTFDSTAHGRPQPAQQHQHHHHHQPHPHHHLRPAAVEQLVYAAHKRLLVSCTADGCVRFWCTQRCRLLLQIDALHRRGESLVALRVDEATNETMVTGDSSGAVRVWDLSALTDERRAHLAAHPAYCAVSATEAAAAALSHGGHDNAPVVDCRPVLFFQAHAQSIVSVEILDAVIGNGGSVPARGPILLTASTDCTAVLWCLRTARKIGTFGQAARWNLDDAATWHEPAGDEAAVAARVLDAHAVPKSFFAVHPGGGAGAGAEGDSAAAGAARVRGAAAALASNVDDIETLTTTLVFEPTSLQLNAQPTPTAATAAAAGYATERLYSWW